MFAEGCDGVGNYAAETSLFETSLLGLPVGIAKHAKEITTRMGMRDAQIRVGVGGAAGTVPAVRVQAVGETRDRYTQRDAWGRLCVASSLITSQPRRGSEDVRKAGSRAGA